MDLVKSTPFEALCNRITTKNLVRDLHIKTLKDILYAYCYMRCKLNMEHLPVSLSDIECLNQSIDPQGIGRNKKIENYIWPNSGQKEIYFRSLIYKLPVDKRDMPPDAVLEEEWWNAAEQRLSPQKLAEYVQIRQWAFPPNIQELLDEVFKGKEAV